MDYTNRIPNVDDLIADLTHIKSRYGNIPIVSYHGMDTCTRVTVKVSSIWMSHEDDGDGKPEATPSFCFYNDLVCAIGYEVDE